MGDNRELEVKIGYDVNAKTITITDTGIGMTHDELVKNLGTVARSGTSKFLEALGDDSADVGMIGMFGVGFYSSFLVADKVTVASKSPSEDTQNIWECINGENSFHVGVDPRGNTLGRGTEITLHLKEETEEYANENRLKTLAHHFSEFITHPISVLSVKTVEVDDEDAEVDEFDGEEKDDLEIEDGDDTSEKPKKEITTETWERVNTQKVIWTRPKDEISDEEYQSFYSTISKKDDKAAAWSHFDAEGNINFKSILYLPEEPEQLAMMRPEEIKGSVKLYVRKVLISDSFSLLPNHLAFIKGVVDSDDLPLNVNRETLQESKIIKIIKKKIARKAIEMIRKFSEKEVEDDSDVHPYNEWFEKFHVYMKAAAIEDSANQERIMKLLRFRTSKSDDQLVSLKDYVERMKDWQTEIYYFTGDDDEVMKESHFMEKFHDKDVEVIYMTHPIDAYMAQNVRDFDSKMLKDITKNVEFKDEDADLVKRREKVYSEKFQPLTKWLKSLYGKEVTKVSVSKRLGKAPAIVTNGPYGQSAHVERIMRSQSYGNDDVKQQISMMKMYREMEINPRHPIVTRLLESAPEEGDETFVPSQELKDSAFFLLDTALLNGGFSLESDDKFSKRMVRVLQSRLGVESLELEEEINPPVEEDVPPEVDLDGIDAINLEGFGEDEF